MNIKGPKRIITGLHSGFAVAQLFVIKPFTPNVLIDYAIYDTYEIGAKRALESSRTKLEVKYKLLK